MSGLTLGNGLTGLVSRETNEANRLLSSLGKSMVTGYNDRVDVVDGFMGRTLDDIAVVLGAIANSTAYTTNLLTIADQYLSSITKSLQDGLKTIGTAGPISADKAAVLQTNLDDNKAQVNRLISTADFDQKSILKGEVTDLDTQVGPSINDKIGVTISDFSSGKLFRSSLTEKFIANVTAANIANYGYYASAAEMATDAAKNNFNLFHAALTGAGGSGTGAAISDANVSAIFVDVLGAAGSRSTKVVEFLTTALPKTHAALAGLATPKDFSTAAAADIEAAFTADATSRTEFNALFADNVATTISDPTNDAARIIAQDVFTEALNLVRKEQASVANQKNNIIANADALRTTTDVTEKASDSYLKTDYVTTAQEYSETIRQMVSSLTALQAANKIPEAAQRLVDALAR